MDDLVKEALLKVVRRLSAEAAYESLYGEDIPESEETEMLARPILFDPRFDLDDDTPLVIDDVSLALTHMGLPSDLRKDVKEGGLEERLVAAETVGDFLSVLKQAWTGGKST